jgi:hypothetical protein
MSSPPSPLLYDAVTLRHFSACSRLDICERVHADRPTPRWVEEVEREIKAAISFSPECSAIVASSWLGQPMAPTGAEELDGIYRLQVALGNGKEPPTRHAGEAQSIFFAGMFGGSIATDDGAAFNFAERRLGVGRVVDTVDILHDAVDSNIISRSDAAAIVAAIRGSGRSLRGARDAVRSAADF